MVVAAYDYTGKPVWQVRPGVFSSVHGYCSSPVIWKDNDREWRPRCPSYIVGLDRKSGKTLWKTSRANRTRSHCVPTLFTLNGKTKMILSGDKSVASYDPTPAKHWVP